MSEGTPKTVVKTAIPRYIEPRKFTRQCVDLSGEVPAESLVRLAEAVASVDSLSAKLSFDVSDDRHQCVNGTLDAKLSLTCQRCLEVYPETLRVSLNLAVVWDEDRAKQLPSTYEPWIVPEETADLYSILEEELLLALPAVAYHTQQCVAKERFSFEPSAQELANSQVNSHASSHASNSGIGPSGVESGEGEAKSINKKNPFQVLEQLKGSSKQ